MIRPVAGLESQPPRAVDDVEGHRQSQAHSLPRVTDKDKKAVLSQK